MLPVGCSQQVRKKLRRGSHSAASGFHGICGVGGIPLYICRWTVGGRHGFTEQAEIDSELSAVVRSMQNAPPENPDALAADVEERHDFEPPGVGLKREKIQPLQNQLYKARLRMGEIETGGQDLIGGRFGRAEKLAEEAALGEQLMFENLGDRARAGMRTEVQVGIGEFAPGGNHFVRFTDVGIQSVLQERISRAGYSAFGDGDEGVMHSEILEVWNATLVSLQHLQRSLVRLARKRREFR